MTRIIPTMYSLRYPETEAIAEALWADRPHRLYRDAWVSHAGFAGAATAQEAHAARFCKRWARWAKAGLVNLGYDAVAGSLGRFPHAYATAGANSALKDLVAECLVRGGAVHCFEGDYEGFSAIATDLGGLVFRHPRPTEERPWPLSLPKAVQLVCERPALFLVSQPSSISGYYWDGFVPWLRWMAEHLPHVEIIVDLTYVGCVRDLEPLDLVGHENVGAVVHSLSKPFGTYYDRIGACASRRPRPQMEANRWFHNELSLEFGERLMEKYEPDFLPQRYAAVQAAVVDEAIRAGKLPRDARPSNVVLMASACIGERPAECMSEGSATGSYRAEGWWRWCLTPAMDAAIRGKDSK